MFSNPMLLVCRAKYFRLGLVVLGLGPLGFGVLLGSFLFLSLSVQLYPMLLN